ncbi:MAG: hypothetical protein RML75_14135, partial [Cyanobacteriota bacterium SKYGB_h_bin112]|nr:hypothetical protein [Cyanobacteriota bacterium SKYGB_h_bin112]
IVKLLTVLGYVFLIGSLTVSCQSANQSAPSPSPSPQVATTLSPVAAGLESGTYCFKLSTATKQASTKLTIAPDQQVSGTLDGIIQDQAASYFTSYQREFKGKLDGEKLPVAVSTKIENDVQTSVEDWTLSKTQLIANQDILNRVDCAELTQAAPAPANTPVASAPSPSKPEAPSEPQSRRMRVNFAAGSNTATVENSVVRGTTDTYLLNARAKQRMRVTITSLENNAVFDIVSPSGNLLQPETSGVDVTNADLTLPETGDYEIVVGGTRGNASYKLRIQID